MSPSSSSSDSLSTRVTALLKKTEHYDKDERYMATSDLCELLKNQRHEQEQQQQQQQQQQQHDGGRIAAASLQHQQQAAPPTARLLQSTQEEQVCTAVLRLLHDNSNDVQAVAVKALGVLLTAVRQDQVCKIADSLTDQVLDTSKDALRDVYAIGLRTTIKTIPGEMGKVVSERLVDRLLSGIGGNLVDDDENDRKNGHDRDEAKNKKKNSKSNKKGKKKDAEPSPPPPEEEDAVDEGVVLACLDILTDLLGRFGALCSSEQHGALLRTCARLLRSSPSPVVRKRVGTTMGCGLSTVLGDALLTDMVRILLKPFEATAAVAAAAPDDSAHDDDAAAAAADNQGGRRHKRQRSPPSRPQRQTRSMTSASKAKPSKSAAKSTAKSSSSPEPQHQQQQQPQRPTDTLAWIRTIGIVASATGHRLSREQIDSIVPIFLRYTDPKQAKTGDDDDDEEDDDGDVHMDEEKKDQGEEDEAAVALANELRESCLSGFESLLLCAPGQVEPHLDQIIQVALAYMSYDPNYSYGDDNDDQDEEEEEDDLDDEYEDDNDDEESYDDEDEDETWKVRRCAIRVLKAVVKAKSHNPGALWTKSYPVRRGKCAVIPAALGGRFKEREENTRVEIMECFTRLMEATVAASSTGAVRFASEKKDVVEMDTGGDDNDNDSNVIDFRNGYAPKLVKACEKVLSIKKGKEERSKSASLALLAGLCRAPGGIGGTDEIVSVLKHVKGFLVVQEADSCTAHTSKTLRLEALSLVNAILSTDKHDPAHVRQSLMQIEFLPVLCEAVKEQWYKVISEALSALAAVPSIFVGGTGVDADKDAKDLAEVSSMLYDSVEPRMAETDVDSEIKECALKACASLLSSPLHSSLTTEQTGRLLALLRDRLDNETTRIAGIKALSAIAASGDDMGGRVDLSSIAGESISTLASFLNYQSRALKQNALEALGVIVINHGSHADLSDGTLYSSVLKNLAPLVVDTDQTLTHLALRATVSILTVCPAAGGAIKEHVLEPSLMLSTSSSLQEPALGSLLELFKHVVTSNATEFQELLSLLRGRLSDAETKNGIYNLAKCIATIAAATKDPGDVQKLFSETFEVLENESRGSSREVQLSLLVTGDLGRQVDLGTLDDQATERLKEVYLQYFESDEEEVKHAAAHALGMASAGSQSTFLPVIVDKLDGGTDSKQQYLLLSALREFIQCDVGGKSISSTLPLILPALEKHCGDEDKGIRTMVAECLGSLTCLEPDALLQKMKELLSSHSAIAVTDGYVDEKDVASKKNALVCSTLAAAVKNAIIGKVDPSRLSDHIPGFLKLVEQEELGVRHAALLMVYSAVHNMPQVVAAFIKDVLAPIRGVVDLKMERKVDLGAFTHTVDDALPLRKAALDIYAACLEHLPGSLDIAAFMPILAGSLGDKTEDVQHRAHQIVVSMCASQQHAAHLVSSLDSFVDPLEKTLNKKQGDKTGTELERLNDWIKSALRAVLALGKLEGAADSSSAKFAEFLRRTESNSKFVPMLQALARED